MKIVSNVKADSSVTSWTRTFGRDGAEMSRYKSSFTRFGVWGKRLEETKLDPTGRIVKKKVFDDQGRISEEVIYNVDGTINFTRVFKYDEAGNEVEVSMYLGGERFHGKWLSMVDSHGRVVERVWYNREGEREVTESCEYDSKGLMRKRVRGNVAEWSYQYDDTGRLIRIVGGYYSSDEPDDTNIEYNDDGHLIKKRRYYSTGTVRSVTIYEYEGDSRTKIACISQCALHSIGIR